MERIGFLLPSLFNNLGIEDAVVLKLIKNKWFEIFNTPLSEHTYPKELKEGKLLVIVNSHAWLNELKLIKEEFIKRLSQYGIKEVAFKFGKIYKNNRCDEKKQNLQLSQEQKLWISEIVKKIKDDEMKSVMENLIKKYIVYVNEKIIGEKNERF
jgi:predicted nucleic acid-binding Zn ribbon protein